jgi:DMSO/TMAO reductase YedYZ molybdopterin-dependent catalytic subunit
MDPTRRQLLKGFAGVGTTWLTGCSSSSGGAPPGPSTGDAGAAGPDAGVCPDELAGGTLLATVPFVGEGPSTLDTATGSNLDGRLYTDLAKLSPDAPAVPTEHFYIRTRQPDLLVPSTPWTIKIHGLVDAPVDVALADLTPAVKPMGLHLLECSGNGAFAAFGMLSTADWSGASLLDLVRSKARVQPAATRVLVSGFDQFSKTSANSTAGASWIFSFQELTDAGAFLATEMNGAPLPPDHGAPVRLLLPGWYGCTCIKWVNEIILVNDDEPATSQMAEFAARTMQNGNPPLARDFVPAVIDQAAMPVRIEKWSLGGQVAYRVVGLMWGGNRLTDALSIRFNPDQAYERVDVCPKPSSNTTWTWWTHTWRPPARGQYVIRLHVDDPTIRTRRLDIGFYDRTVAIDEV